MTFASYKMDASLRMITFGKMARLIVTLLMLFGFMFGVFAAPGKRVRRHFVAHPGSVPGYGGYSGGGGGGGGGGGSGYGGQAPGGQGNIGIPAAGQTFSKSSASASSMSGSGGFAG